MKKHYVSRVRLRRLFQRHGVWERIRQEYYSCKARDKVSVPVKPGHRPADGVQLIHKWADASGRHVVTTHAVLDSAGWPVHWCEKDLIVMTTKYIHRHDLDLV